MNKKFFTTILVIIILFVTFPAFCGGGKDKAAEETAQPAVETKVDTSTTTESTSTASDSNSTTVSTSVARITYGDSTYTVKRDDVNALIASAKESNVEMTEDEAILNISSQILLQMKLKELISSHTNEELSQMGLYLIANEASKYGYTLETQEQFEAYCKSAYNTSLEEYISYVVQNYLLLNYIYTTYPSFFEYEVKDEYVESFYEANVEANPETFKAGPFVKLSHILFAFKEGEAKADTLDRANNILLQIKSGALSFEDAVKESDDTSTKENGGLVPGYAEKDSQTLSYYFGTEASDIIFALKVGEISKLIEGPAGYHIVKVNEFVAESVLTLDDPLTPGSEETLRDYLAYEVSAELESSAFTAAQNKLISDLIDAADIKRFN